VTPADTNEHDGEPVTTVMPEPRRRVFRRLTPGGRLADFAWRWAQRLIFHPSPTPFHAWRRWVLRLFGAKIHPSAVIHRSVRIIHPWNLTVGPGTTIRQRVILDCQAPVTIGAHTEISQFTHLCTATHVYNRRDMPILGQPISIGDRCWLAADVFVACGVKIADGVVVGARASVFRDITANTVAIGEPAKPLASH
jgi:putative colanic acid biosynthesis acetyltransferase WcaF